MLTQLTSLLGFGNAPKSGGNTETEAALIEFGDVFDAEAALQVDLPEPEVGSGEEPPVEQVPDGDVPEVVGDDEPLPRRAVAHNGSETDPLKWLSPQVPANTTLQSEKPTTSQPVDYGDDQSFSFHTDERAALYERPASRSADNSREIFREYETRDKPLATKSLHQAGFVDEEVSVPLQISQAGSTRLEVEGRLGPTADFRAEIGPAASVRTLERPRSPHFRFETEQGDPTREKKGKPVEQTVLKREKSSLAQQPVAHSATSSNFPTKEIKSNRIPAQGVNTVRSVENIGPNQEAINSNNQRIIAEATVPAVTRVDSKIPFNGERSLTRSQAGVSQSIAAPLPDRTSEKLLTSRPISNPARPNPLKTQYIPIMSATKLAPTASADSVLPPKRSEAAENQNTPKQTAVPLAKDDRPMPDSKSVGRHESLTQAFVQKTTPISGGADVKTAIGGFEEPQFSERLVATGHNPETDVSIRISSEQPLKTTGKTAAITGNENIGESPIRSESKVGDFLYLSVKAPEKPIAVNQIEPMPPNPESAKPMRQDLVFSTRRIKHGESLDADRYETREGPHELRKVSGLEIRHAEGATKLVPTLQSFPNASQPAVAQYLAGQEQVSPESDLKIEGEEWAPLPQNSRNAPQNVMTSPINPQSSLSRADVPSIIRQISEGFSRVQDGAIELRLSPEELGRVRMFLVTGEAGLTVNIQAERPETLDLMRRNVDELARNLAEAGYENAGFSFGDNRGQEKEGGFAEQSPSEPSEQPQISESTPQHVPTDGIDIRI